MILHNINASIVQVQYLQCSRTCTKMCNALRTRRVRHCTYMKFKIKILNKRIIYLYIIVCTNNIYQLQYYHVGNQEFYDSGRSSHSRVVVNSLMSHFNS